MFFQIRLSKMHWECIWRMLLPSYVINWCCSKTPKKVQTSICMIDVIKPDQISKFKNQYSTISKSNFNMVLTPSTVKDSFYPRKSGTKHADTSIWPMQGTMRLWTVMDYMTVIVKLWNHTWNAWRVTKTSGLIQEVH